MNQNTTRRARRLMICGLIGTSLARPVSAIVAQAGAGVEPKVLYACYEPKSGKVYRIKEAGTPQDCTSPKHVMFSWNAGGPPGPAGPKGDPGPPGSASGPEARVCPEAHVVVGFSSSGSIICAPAGVGAPKPPPPPPPPVSRFDGTWKLTPPISSKCQPSVLSLDLAVERATTRQIAPDSLLVTFDYSVGFYGLTWSQGLRLPFDSSAGTFGVSGSAPSPNIVPSVSLGPGITGTLNSAASVSGAFKGSDTATAVVAATASITDIKSKMLAVPKTVTCEPIDTTVVATRVGI